MIIPISLLSPLLSLVQERVKVFLGLVMVQYLARSPLMIRRMDGDQTL
jgi:hypothetical protein